MERQGGVSGKERGTGKGEFDANGISVHAKASFISSSSVDYRISVE
jgi:hypothetical protein